ncbi:MAG TPA: HDIG domain-containing protein [Clostridiales bacterium]|nr:HDIG domain-containing protein [Clostridiales bacterium]
MFSPDRERALALLHKHNQSQSLRSHALAVEAAMRHMAKVWGEDEDYWAEVGLLHDVDYEEFPQEHLKHTPEILKSAGYDDDFIRAVLAHGWGICTDVKPEKKMEKALYAADELCGLVTAAAYMRPSRSVVDLEVPSLKKKFKDKKFAAGVDRQVILQGCEMLGITLEELMQLVIDGMRENHEEIGV